MAIGAFLESLCAGARGFLYMRSLRTLVFVWYAAACLAIITSKETMSILSAPGILTVAQVSEGMDKL